jgi:outer membrane receptor protein involved in Fe transport
VCIIAAPLGAQEVDQPEIIVTAPAGSDTVDLRNTPNNARVLSGDPLSRQGSADLASLLNANLGSVTVSNSTGSPYQSDVSYRGFEATSLLGSPTGLSVYLDGVRMNEPFGSIVNWDLIPMNAIEAVEVLPGANPLFGLNTLGGSLVLTTKNGSDNRGASLLAQVGSFDRRSAEVEAGGRLGGSAFDWFVSSNYDQDDGYRLHSSTSVKQLYGKLRWHGAASHLELGTIWSDTSLSGTQGLPLSMLSHPKLAYTWPDNTSDHQLILNLKGETRLAPRVNLSGNVYYRRTNAASINSNAALADGCGTGSRDCRADAPNGTALDLYVNNPFAPGTAQYLNFLPYGGELPIHDFTSNIATSLVSSNTRQKALGGNTLLDLDDPLFGLDSDLNLGGNFETAKIRYDQRTALAQLVGYEAVPIPSNYRYGSTGGFATIPLISNVSVTSRESSFNLFARDTLKLSKSFALTGSLSYTFSHTGLDGLRSRSLADNGAFAWASDDGLTHYNPGYAGASYWMTADSLGANAGSFLAVAEPPTGAVPGPELTRLSGSHAYRHANPAIGFAWNASKAVGFFGDYSQAMRAPTAIELACADPASPCSLPTGFNGDPTLKPVIAHSFEAGARGTFGRLKWNAAAYRSSLANDIQFVFDSSGLGYFANVGKTMRRGVEAGISADLQRVHLSASYGYVRATYRSTFIDAEGHVVEPGSRIAGIPSQSLKVRAVFDPTKALTVGSNLIVVAGQYAHGDEANRHAPVPGYATINLDAHLILAKRAEVFANLNNVLDRRYSTFGLMGTNIYTGQEEQFRTPAPGRILLVGLRYNLGNSGP